MDRATLEAAARWYAALREAAPDSDVHEALGEWLERDPAHRRAWQRVEKLNARLGDAPAEFTRPTLEKARAARRRAAKLVLLVAGVAGLLAAGLQTELRYRLTADHYVGTGERTTLRLPDGTGVELNTQTAVDVLFDDKQRQIRLLAGEILVATAPDDAGRPFIVTTEHGRSRALGTRFVVRGEDGASRVSVLEGAVEISAAAAAGRPTRVVAGRQARFTQQTVGPPAPITGDPAAWARGQLIVSDWRLGRFLDELSRYRPGVLVYDDAVADLRISGAFHIDDTDAVLENLAATLPVRIRRFTPLWTRVEPQ